MNDFPEPQKKPERKLNYHERVKAGLQRGGLNKISKKRQKSLQIYNKAISEIPHDSCCCKCGSREILEIHHPKGRKFIDNFIIVCHRCHEWIHSNANEAMRLGWLHPEIRGLKPNEEA